MHYNLKKDRWWLSICHDMKLELIYSPEEREPGKKYKRYRMSGYDLVEHIFSDYTVNFAKECEEREKKEQQEKDLRNKKLRGSICKLFL